MVNLTAEQEKVLKYQYKKAIFNYLKGRVEKDTDLAEAIKKPNKTIDGVINYITAEAKKQAQGNVAVIPDEEIFNWAVHYILEDSLNYEKGANNDRGSKTAGETGSAEHEDQCNSEDGNSAELCEERKAAGKTQPEKKRSAAPVKEPEKSKSIEEQMQDFYAESELFRGL